MFALVLLSEEFEGGDRRVRGGGGYKLVFAGEEDRDEGVVDVRNGGC